MTSSGTYSVDSLHLTNKYSTDTWHQLDLIVTNPSIRFSRMTWLAPVSKISSSDKHQEIKLWAFISVHQNNLCLFGAYSYSERTLALLPSELMEGNIKFRLPVANISSHAKVCGWCKLPKKGNFQGDSFMKIGVGNIYLIYRDTKSYLIQRITNDYQYCFVLCQVLSLQEEQSGRG